MNSGSPFPPPEHAFDGTKIALVTPNYAPEFAGIGPYATELAEHFADHGAEVDVITLMPHYPSWRVDPRYTRKLAVKEAVNGVRIHRIWNLVREKQNLLTRGLFESSFLAHGFARGLPARPDVVLAIVPSIGGATAAALLAKRLGVPFGLIVQDLMGAAARQSGMPLAKVAAGLITRAEHWLFEQANAVAVICGAFEKHLLDAGVSQGKISVLRNWTRALGKPTKARSEVRASLGWREDEFIVLHAGNMGHKQALEHVVAAAKLVTVGDHIRFVLMGDGSQRPKLEAMSRGVPAISFLEPCLSAELPNRLFAADALLVNERSAMKDMSLPSKLTSYFAVARPVLAALNPHGATAAELESANAALVVHPESGAALADGARTLRADTTRCEALGHAGLKHAERHLQATNALRGYERFVLSLLGRQPTRFSKSVAA